MRLLSRAVVVAAALTLFCATAAQAAPAMQAGVGRSDITPPTGFPTFGYVRDDAIARGVQTRLYARAIVLREGAVKLAIVTLDLGATPGGLLSEVAARLPNRGFTEQNIIMSASHTHSGPAGYSPFTADDFVAPTSGDLTHYKLEQDTRLYGFLITRIALAVARADSNLGPAQIGWGRTQLLGVTDNRSLEAHLADFGYDLPYGTGKVSQDPGGYPDTIDPEVDVLRIDRIKHHRRVPLGGWLDFADHGTVNPYQLGVYNADHTGIASRTFEAAVRKAGHVPVGQDVVGAYGNADAGDLSAALRGRGPAYAQYVGDREASAMLSAWRQAGKSMSSSPAFDLRWSRSCFCGRSVDGGAVDTKAVVGLPFLTGSEENRGPLYDVTHQQYEGFRLAVGVGPQSRKIQAVPPPIANFPAAVPLMVVRVGSRLIATIPGEATAETGRRIRAAVGSADPGTGGVVLAGYSNEYIHYFTTPQEYDQQHYEGGSTLYGKFSSNLIMDDLAALAKALGQGQPAPAPYAFDPRNSLVPNTTPYGQGAGAGAISEQPSRTARLQRATFVWSGGTLGLDRPLDRPFITVQRRLKRRWRAVTNDLGAQILWKVDDLGRYTAEWQIPLNQRTGRYRFLITANRYRLHSKPFRVTRARSLTVKILGRRNHRVLFNLAYPPIDMLADLLDRPAIASAGTVLELRHGRLKRLSRRRKGATFSAPAGARVVAEDRYGNASAPVRLPG